MGYERGLSAVYLEDSDRVAQIEYIYHTDFIKKVSGIDPFDAPREALARTYDKLNLDMVFFTLQSYDPYSQSRETGSKFITTEHWSRLFPSSWRVSFPVNSVEDVLSYEPSEELGERSPGEIVDFFSSEHSEVQRLFKSQVVPGGYYCTTFMWFVMTFGLEWTIKAAGRDPKRFENLLNKFAQISLRDFEAWAQCDIKVFISHDDICMTEGPIFSRKWFRRYLFPWYKRLWNVLHNRGIKVLFCSDGNITPIVDDLAEAGADGFIIEPCCDLEYIAEKYGDNKVIIGNIDIKTLTFKSRKEVVEEVKRCLSTAGAYPGFFLNVTGSIPDNVPIGNLETYFAACKKYGKRRP